jgi:hypothetical protein
MRLANIFSRLYKEPFPFRSVCKVAIRKFEIGSYRFRYDIGALYRNNYAYIVYNAAQLAARLGEPRVSILEFGVAGGAGLLSLEAHAKEVEKVFPVKIEIYGFDTGAGLPALGDYRDLPYLWKPSMFKIDLPALQARLERSKLILGNVKDTVESFLDTYKPAPIGAVSHDMDLYSSTADGLKLFDADARNFLPRVFCYFDDTIGSEIALYGDFTGERLAIAEFNETHGNVKLSPIYYLRSMPFAPSWHHKMWSAHFFSHEKYNQFVSDENQQLPI